MNTRFKPNSLTIKGLSALLLSGIISFNTMNAQTTQSGGDDDSTLVDSIYVEDSAWVEDEADFLAWLDEMGFEDEDDYYAYLDSLEENDLEIPEDLDYFFDDEDWSDEDEADFLAWLDEMGFEDEDDYYAYLDSLEENDLEIPEDLDYFFDDEDWSDEDEEDFLTWLDEMGFDSEEAYFDYLDSLEDNGLDIPEELVYFLDDIIEDDIENGEDYDYDGDYDDEDWSEEDEEDFLEWLSEMGFEDEDEYFSYLDSLEENGLDIPEDLVYFLDDEMDLPSDISDWEFDSEDEFLDFVYGLGFECADDFFAYFHDIDDEWECEGDYYVYSDDEDYDDNDYDDEDWTEEDENDFIAWLDEMGFDDEDDYEAYLDSLEEMGEDIDEDYYYEEEDEDFIAWLDEMGFDDEDDYEAYLDSLEEMGEDIDEDYYYEDEDDYFYWEDEDYFDAEEEYYTFIEELGFEDEDDFYTYLDQLEDLYGHLGCDVDTTWMDDVDEDDIDFEMEDCGNTYTVISDSNYAAFTVVGNADEVLWYFGDGDYSDEANPTHEYEYSGTYEVCMFTFDSTEQCYSEYCDLVDVLVEDDDLCDIIITWEEDEDGEITFDVEFDCYNRNEYTVFWQFGNLDNATGDAVSYSYTEAGTYQVCATIKLNDGTVLSTECVEVESRAGTQETGIEDLVASNFKAKLYPNPVKDQLNFEFNIEEKQDLNIQVVDIYGKVVLNITNTYFVGNNNIQLNVNNLTAGVYYLKVQNNAVNVSKQFTIMQ